jgi:sec-independent protein translocase protein TatC
MVAAGEKQHSEKQNSEQRQKTEEELAEELLHGGKVMSLWDHLGELRTRLVRSMIAVMVFFAAIFAFGEEVIGFLKGPLVQALPQGANALHFTGPMDVFLANVKVSFIGAITFAGPVWLHQFWKFFEPALYPRERKYILPFIAISVLLFFAGISFGYFVILPITLEYLLDLGIKVGTPIITVNDYLNLLTLMVLGFGVIFETPVLLVLLGLMEIITASDLRAHRRVIFIVILVVSAVLTPSPDPLSQMAMAIPVYLMFEAAVLIIAWLKPEPKKSPENSVAVVKS